MFSNLSNSFHKMWDYVGYMGHMGFLGLKPYYDAWAKALKNFQCPSPLVFQ